MTLKNELSELVGNLSKPPVTPDNIHDSTNLIEDLGFDSLQILNLILSLETEFEVNLPIEKIGVETFSSYKKLFEIVNDLSPHGG